MREVRRGADDARQSVPGTAINVSMLRVLALSAFIAATPTPEPAGAADGYDSGRVAWVTDGDTFRLESGERIRIAGIDAPETHRGQARCAGEVLLGLRAKDRAAALLAEREITFRRVCRSYKRTVATVVRRPWSGHGAGADRRRGVVAARASKADLVRAVQLN